MEHDRDRSRLLDRMQEVIDHHDITKVLHAYCHGCDRLDKARMASVYATDSWDDHGDLKCAGADFVEQTIEAMAKTTTMCSHALGQSQIQVTGDEAGAETYFTAAVRMTDDSGGESLNLLGARYVDTMVREQGHWKIKTRVVVRDWSISLPITSDWLAVAAFVQGKRSNADPSFAALRLQHSAVATS